MEIARKLETFKGKREADNLREMAVLAAILLIIIVFVVFSFSLGLIQPFFNTLLGITTTTTSVLNTPSTAIPVQVLVSDYAHSPASAANRYSDQSLYISGNISGADDPGQNSYGFCINPANLNQNPYDCSIIPGTMYWVIWQWQVPSEAMSVPTNSSFVAFCSVGGMSSDDLYLNSCAMVP